MITSNVTVCPDTAAEAYRIYSNAASAVFIAGGQRLKYSKKHYDTAVDLSQTGLKQITETADEIVVGSMATLARLQVSPMIKALAGGAVSTCISTIADKNVRTHSTIGAVLAVKEPFSVLLPILLSLQVDVVLEGKGRMNLRDYLGCPPMGEMVTQIRIAKERVYTAFAAYRVLPADEPYLTGAVAMLPDSWRIVIGGRPGRAAIAENASTELTEKGMAARENVAHIASEELDFGDYGTCSEQERRDLAIEMVRKLVKNAWKGYNRLPDMR
ncbi:MAG: FAD binding domain-containing protein [Megasphaera sp.]|nr:FAD binding domain-containing protein [Megasphaera sp.]